MIKLRGVVPEGTRILLSDKLLNLNKPVFVVVNDQPARTFRAELNLKVMRAALRARLGFSACSQAAITLD